jgi:serine/threonine protein kinase
MKGRNKEGNEGEEMVVEVEKKDQHHHFKATSKVKSRFKTSKVHTNTSAKKDNKIKHAFKKLQPGKLIIKDFDHDSLKAMSKPEIDNFDKVMKHFKSVWGSLQKHGNTRFKDTCTKKLLGLGGFSYIVQCDNNTVLKLPKDISPQHKSLISKEVEIFDANPTLRESPHIVSPNMVLDKESGCFTTQCPPGCFFMHKWGMTLDHFLRDDTCAIVDAETLLKISEAMCGAIQHMGHMQFIHNDVKPANILLDLDASKHVEHVGMCDMGSVRSIQTQYEASKDGFQGTTLGFRSPEMAFGINTISTASDLFSVVVTLLACLFKTFPIIPVDHHLNLREQVKMEIKGLAGLVICEESELNALALKMQHKSYQEKALLKLIEYKSKNTNYRFWKQLEAMNILDTDFTHILKQCLRFSPDNRPCFGSLSVFNDSMKYFLEKSKRYVWRNTRSRNFLLNLKLEDMQMKQQKKPTRNFVDWQTFVEITRRHFKPEDWNHYHEHLLWFVLILWSRNPENVSLVKCWFTRGLPTVNVLQFQDAACLMWKGDPQWMQAVKEACQASHGRRPKSIGEFYRHFLKMPLTMVKKNKTFHVKTPFETHISEHDDFVDVSNMSEEKRKEIKTYKMYVTKEDIIKGEIKEKKCMAERSHSFIILKNQKNEIVEIYPTECADLSRRTHCCVDLYFCSVKHINKQRRHPSTRKFTVGFKKCFKKSSKKMNEWMNE